MSVPTIICVRSTSSFRAAKSAPNAVIGVSKVMRKVVPSVVSARATVVLSTLIIVSSNGRASILFLVPSVNGLPVMESVKGPTSNGVVWNGISVEKVLKSSTRVGPTAASNNALSVNTSITAAESGVHHIPISQMLNRLLILVPPRLSMNRINALLPENQPSISSQLQLFN